MSRSFSQLLTYRLTPNAPVEHVLNEAFRNLCKDEALEELSWGRWVEDESFVDVLITWQGGINSINPEKAFRYLSPLNAHLRGDIPPVSLVLESSLSGLHLTRDDGAHVTITSFRIPASAYAADPGIKQRIVDVFRALAHGDPRHGSHYIPPPEDEIPLSHRIGTAAGHWSSAWVESGSSSTEKNDDKRWIACLQWDIPHLETEFKARQNRHFLLRLQKIDGIHGLDIEDSSDAKFEEDDPVLASRAFWKPITETWDTSFEEHHVLFRKIDKYSMVGNGSWSSCIIQ
ncbi:hypothetical protein TSTA_082090 [Talaromyces stipitatus ATCC 10500]|uniref:Uncharacterized protein n=1 Tax=Talaromyces stipitatus (strain ATCC 10500 / CBS 375.48 / QM 6759 / NRRL 1006) TaxID=441959 RepID=B8M134_TALSN|nr:uncharacterized protein TSTA_082090 [Talaromyces stipitatus ATCC 10500]EED20976.1 hypothetical protein TSTA_082090 [Talaromyces stipitatus ATCC 10500]